MSVRKKININDTYYIDLIIKLHLKNRIELNFLLLHIFVHISNITNYVIKRKKFFEFLFTFNFFKDI